MIISNIKGIDIIPTYTNPVETNVRIKDTEKWIEVQNSFTNARVLIRFSEVVAIESIKDQNKTRIVTRNGTYESDFSIERFSDFIKSLE